MTLPPLSSQLEVASSLPDLAQRLGAFCMDNGGQLGQLAASSDVEPVSGAIEARVEGIDLEEWQTPGEAGLFAHMLEVDGLGDLVAVARAHHPIEYLAVLRGLCRGPLTRFYESTEERVLLDRGAPVPLASRPIHLLYGKGHTTPNPRTLLDGHLLGPLGFKLFEYSAGGKARVVLDFGHRERIDQLTWSEGRLPRIATLHPFLGAGGIEIGEETRSWFFDVKPKVWNAETVLAELRRVSDAEIAVLPELCLPLSDALEDAIGSDPQSYSPLIVAGSAHVREPDPSDGHEIRANESRIYLDGSHIAVHRKIHPFRTKHLGGRDLADRISEGLTSEPKTITVLSGEHSRLAVVICADLNDDLVPQLLQGAGVNFLLVPAFTGGIGAFNGVISDLASRCQAVAVVVNAALDPDPNVAGSGPPFLVLAAVPRPKPDQQSKDYYAPSEGQPGIGVVDPNDPLDAAMIWLSRV
jgi:hypothetical protein